MRWFLRFGLLSACLCCSPAASALLINGDFADGLAGWSHRGDVSISPDGAARLGEGTGAVTAAVLYQGVAVSDGLLQFDLRADLSDQIVFSPPFFGLPDTLAVSLYFSADLAGFSLDPFSPAFDDVLPLFDLDYLGVLLMAGQLAPHPERPAPWLRYQIRFQHPFRYAIAAFELIDANGRDDSQVWIADVRLMAVPSPGVLPLLLFALALPWWRRDRVPPTRRCPGARRGRRR